MKKKWRVAAEYRMEKGEVVGRKMKGNGEILWCREYKKSKGSGRRGNFVVMCGTILWYNSSLSALKYYRVN